MFYIGVQCLTSHVATRMSPGKLHPSNSYIRWDESPKLDGNLSTKGCKDKSKKALAFSQKLLIPATIGHPGGLAESLWILARR